MIGAALHLGIRVLGVLRSTVPLRFRLDLQMPAVREFIRLMVPKMLSHPIEPLTFLFFTSVATTLAAGSVSAISFARNFQSVPVALIGISIAVAAFPGLSAAWAAGDRSGFAREVRRHALTIGVLSTVAAVGLAVVGPIAIEVLLGGGKFDAEDVAVTAAVLAAFALAVPFDSLGHLMARGLYATHNTLLPVLAAVAGLRRDDRRDARAPGARGRAGDPARVRRRDGGPDGAPGPRAGAADARRAPAGDEGGRRRRRYGVSGWVGTTAMNSPSRAGYSPSGRFHGR